MNPDLERLHKALAELMPADRVADWLRTPNAAFGGRSPQEVVESGDLDRFWRMIALMEANVAT